MLLVKVQCVPGLPSAAKMLDAGPEPASLTVLVIANEHLPATCTSAAQFGPVPRYQTVVPAPE